MRNISKFILLLIALVPMVASAQPGKKGKKGKKGKAQAQVVVVEQSPAPTPFVVVGKKPVQGHAMVAGRTPGHAVKPMVVVHDRHAAREAQRREAARRRAQLLMNGRTWFDRPVVVVHSANMQEVRFQRLLALLERTHSPAARLALLSDLAIDRHFTVRQAKKVLNAFRGDRQKLQALSILRFRIVDGHNFHRLVSTFRSSAARWDAAMMLAEA